MLTDKQRAEKNYPDNEPLQQKWLSAVSYLRGRKKWVLEGGNVTWKQ